MKTMAMKTIAMIIKIYNNDNGNNNNNDNDDATNNCNKK